MGLFQVEVAVSDAQRQRFEELQPWVDTGALISQFPGDFLEELGYEADTTSNFRLADGSVIERQIGDVRIRIGREVRTIPCVFGEVGVETLLGATALEIFRLSADPVSQTLNPVMGLMLTMFPAEKPS